MSRAGVTVKDDIVLWKEAYRKMVDDMKDMGCSFMDVYNIIRGWLDEEFDKEYPSDDDED